MTRGVVHYENPSQGQNIKSIIWKSYTMQHKKLNLWAIPLSQYTIIFLHQIQSVLTKEHLHGNEVTLLLNIFFASFVFMEKFSSDTFKQTSYTCPRNTQKHFQVFDI